MPVRAIARRYSISEKLIRVKAKSEGWAKDLASQVATGVKEAVIRASSAKGSAPADNAALRKKTADIVASAIEQGKVVVLKHQALGKVLTHNSELIAQIIGREIAKVEKAMEEEPSEELKPAEQFQRAVSLAKRLEILSKAHDNIARASLNAVTIERKSRGLDDQPADPDAPPSIHVTFYRSDKVLNVKSGGLT
jgi:hypothetical protein